MFNDTESISLHDVKLIPKIVYGVDSNGKLYIFLKIKNLADNKYIKDILVVYYADSTPINRADQLDIITKIKAIKKCSDDKAVDNSPDKKYFFIKGIISNDVKGIEKIYVKIIETITGNKLNDFLLSSVKKYGVKNI